ncbi:hypothetical protein MSG28_014160 [Choristoneura fumiferana]|uniref:Uncharacterized protein n=1 Tax=Choristoneura fumiferana TaxID=7141 RepID=A0ACC0JG76_CHOFU|nr:hypothetical protein MSG28_014160 [Choristoneura fumiferana]
MSNTTLPLSSSSKSATEASSIAPSKAPIAETTSVSESTSKTTLVAETTWVTESALVAETTLVSEASSPSAESPSGPASAPPPAPFCPVRPVDWGSLVTLYVVIACVCHAKRFYAVHELEQKGQG